MASFLLGVSFLCYERYYAPNLFNISTKDVYCFVAKKDTDIFENLKICVSFYNCIVDGHCIGGGTSTGNYRNFACDKWVTKGQSQTVTCSFDLSWTEKANFTTTVSKPTLQFTQSPSWVAVGNGITFNYVNITAKIVGIAPIKSFNAFNFPTGCSRA